MKPLPVALAALTLIGLAGCGPDASRTEADRRLQERLDKIEAQLGRLEAALAAKPAAPQNEITIYLSGSVKNPGRYTVPREISLLAALAVAGGPTEHADLKKVTISRPGTEARLVTDKAAFQDVPLQDGDVVTVSQSFW